MERVLRKARALSLGRYARKLFAMPAAGALAAEVRRHFLCWLFLIWWV
jgi:hypothetical protein